MEIKIKQEQEIPHITTREIMIINLPVIGFIGLALLCLGIAFLHLPEGTLRILLLLTAWWSLSGSIMLLYDYKNKRRTYLILIRRKQISPVLVKKLRDTICGFCLYVSYLYRKGKEKKAPSAKTWE